MNYRSKEYFKINSFHMSKVLLDISKHKLFCTPHAKDSKAAQFICFENGCEQRLCCFSCLRTHQHTDRIRNINELFRLDVNEYTLNPSRLRELEGWLSATYNVFQEKFESMTSFLQKMMCLFEESEQREVRLQAFNSLESLANVSSTELQNAYRQFQFGEVIKDGPAINSLIQYYIKLLEGIEDKCPKRNSEKLKESIMQIVETVGTLNNQLENVVEFLDSVGLISKIDVKREHLSSSAQASQKFESKISQEMVPENTDPVLSSGNHYQASNTKEFNAPRRTVTNKRGIEEEQAILQSDLKIDSLPVVSAIDTQNAGRTRSPIRTQNDVAERAFTKERAPAAVQRDENYFHRSDRMEEEHPILDSKSVLKKISSVLNQQDTKPKLAELVLLLKEADQCAFDESCVEYKIMKDLTQEGQQLLKKHNSLTSIYKEESEAFKNKINKTLSNIATSNDSDGKAVELTQVKKDLKALRRKVTDYMKSKLKSKEDISSIIKELEESKLDFSLEIKVLENLLEKSAAAMAALMNELESPDHNSKKISVSEFTRRFLELFDYPFKFEEHSKLIKQFFSIQKIKGGLVEIINSSSRAKLNPGEESKLDPSLLETAKKIIRKISSKEFQKFDFEKEGESVIEIRNSFKTKKSGQLKGNLPQSEQKKKKIAEPKAKRKSKPLETNARTENQQVLPETKPINEAPKEEPSSSLNMWNLQKIRSEFFNEKIEDSNSMNAEREVTKTTPVFRSAVNNPFMQQDQAIHSQDGKGGKNPFFGSQWFSQNLMDSGITDNPQKKIKGDFNSPSN